MDGLGNVILRLQVLPANTTEIRTLTGTGSHGVERHPRQTLCLSPACSHVGPPRASPECSHSHWLWTPKTPCTRCPLLEHSPMPALTHLSSRTSCSTTSSPQWPTQVCRLWHRQFPSISADPPLQTACSLEAGNVNSLDPQHPQKELVLNKHDGGISKLGSLWKGHCPRILSLSVCLVESF